MPADFLAQVAVMAAVTYLIRALPLALCRGRLQSPWLRDLLFYVPYAALGAMTFPDVFTSTGNLVSALAGTATAFVLSYYRKGLVTVACSAIAVVYIVELLL